MDNDNPCVITPTVQTGASATQYYSDYAYIVNGTTSVRAVRVGGSVMVLTMVCCPSSRRAFLRDLVFGGGLLFPSGDF